MKIGEIDHKSIVMGLRNWQIWYVLIEHDMNNEQI